MKITVSDSNITLQADDTSAPLTLLTKPDIADYGNVTVRPLVTSYHLPRESIWARFGQCLQTLEEHCQEDSCLACYAMAFSALYAPLLSSSQSKNILCCVSERAVAFLSVLQNFMSFLRADNSLLALPGNPFVLSGFANGSWHAAIIDLDSCRHPRTLCDIMTKVRINGVVLLYTMSDTLPDSVRNLLRSAVKTHHTSCTLYVLTMNAELSALFYGGSSESFILLRTENLPAQMEVLQQLTNKIIEEHDCPDDCLQAMELLRQTENMFFEIYDYLEDPKLPVHTNVLKESVLDCYTALTSPLDIEAYTARLKRASQTFFTAIEREFQ